MAIEVGALMMAIGADNRAALRALEQLDRAGEDSDRRNTQYALNQLNLSFKREQAIRNEERALKRYQQAVREGAANPESSGAVVTQALERYEDARRRRAALDNRVASASVAAEQVVAAERRRIADLSAKYYEAENRAATKSQQLKMRLAAERMGLEATAIARVQKAERAAYVEDERRTRQRMAQEANLARQKQLDADAQVRQAQRAAQQQLRAAGSAARGLYQPFGGGVGGGLSTFGITGTLVGAGALAGILRAANDYQLMQQRLQQVANSGEEVRVLFDELTASSNRLRVPVADVTELFVKLRQSNNILGLTYGQTIKVTDAFSAALRISGATGQTASSSLLQFGQAMAKGKLDGDEFRTVAENASEVLRVLERQTGKTRGEILKMREEGKLTAQMMANALIAEADELQKKVSALAPTISQAAVSFRNSVIQMIGGSKDLQASMDSIAGSIVTFGDLLRDNSPAILGVGKIVLELWALHRVIGAIIAIGGIGGIAAGLSAFAIANPVLASIAALGAAVVAVTGSFDIGVKQAQQAIADRIAAEAEGYKQLVANREAAESRLNAITKRAGATEKEITQAKLDLFSKEEVLADRRKKIQSDYTQALYALGRAELEAGKTGDRSRLAALNDRLQRAKSLLDQTIGRDNVLASGGGAAEAVAPKKGKEAKDTTDELISSLLDLYEAEQLSEEGLKRLTDLRAREQSILNNGTEALGENEAAYKRLAEAQKRIERIDAILNPREDLPEQADNVALLADNYDLLSASMLEYANAQIRARIVDLETQLRDENLEIAKRVELLKELAKLQSIGKGEKENEMLPKRKSEGREAPRTRFQEIMDDLRRTLAEAPGDIATTFFAALGEQMASGGNAFRERMRGIFSNLFGNVGSSLIRAGIDRMWPVIKGAFGSLMVKMGAITGAFGKFLTAIQKALTNPLTAGLAMVAIGAGMVMYGARMGAAGRGGDASLGGGFGGLSIGESATKPTVYTFDNRNPFAGAGERTAKPREAAVVFAPTIIGPNDPVAQRGLAQMFDNAARRGLMSGSGPRTG